MIFRKLFNTNVQAGLLSIDVLVALALSVIYVAFLSEANWSASEIFYRAKTKEDFLSAFEAGEADVSLAKTKYGNERKKEIYSIASTSLKFERIIAEQEEFPGTSLCNPVFSRVKETVVHMLPVDPEFPLTDIEVRNGVAYVSSDSSDASFPDLFIFRLNGYDTVLLDSENTGPGISSLSLNLDRVFAAAASSAYQLHVLSLDKGLKIASTSKYKLPLPYATASPAFASSVFSRGRTLLLGTEKWHGRELFLYDISDPVTPVLKGSHEIGSKINDIFFWKNKVYVAASAEDQLIEYEINDSGLSRLFSFSPSGWERQIGTSVNLFEDSLSFGRNSGGFNMIEDHELFKWSTPDPDAIVDNSADLSGGVYGITPSASKIAFASRKSGSEFMLINKDVSTSSIQYFDLPVLPQTVACDNSSIYVLAKSAPVIYEFKMLGP